MILLIFNFVFSLTFLNSIYLFKIRPFFTHIWLDMTYVIYNIIIITLYIMFLRSKYWKHKKIW